jgi:hypothetical protein
MNYFNTKGINIQGLYNISDNVKLFNNVIKERHLIGGVRIVRLNPVVDLESSIFRTLIDMLYEEQIYKVEVWMSPKLFFIPIQISEPLIISKELYHKTLHYYTEELFLNAYKILKINKDDYDTDDYVLVFKVIDIHESIRD